MDLMNLLRSIEALLFELVSWLVFYPATLLRCIRNPHKMMRYADAQLNEAADRQFIDTVAPPLFLFLTLFISHVIGRGFGTGDHIIAGPLQDERSLLIFQAVLNSLFPLIAALQTVWMAGRPLTRATLRPAFYSQCYLAGPFVLVIDLAAILGPYGGTIGIIAGTSTVAALVWYMGSLTLWFKRHGRISLRAACLRSTCTFGLATLILMSTATIVVFAIGPDAIG